LLGVGEFFFCAARVSVAMVGEGDAILSKVAAVLNAVGQMVEREGDRLRKALKGFKTFVHCIECGADGKDGDDDTDHDGDLLFPRCRSDEVAGF